MGIIAKQASRNAVFIFLGVILGAINNVFVLPNAFAEFKSELGLLVLLVSIAAISAPFISFSANSVLVNFLPKISSESEKNGLVRKLVLFCFLGIGLFSLAWWLGESLFLSWMKPEDALLLKGNVKWMLLLTASISLYQFLSGYLQGKYKSVLISALNDPVLKGSYLLLAVLYLFKVISFDTLLVLYVGSYLLVTLIAYFYARSLGFSVANTQPFTSKELWSYAFYSVLDKGSGILVQRIDILMITFILDLELTAEYAIAFFIGSVVFIPHKSIGAISGPIVSKELGKNNMLELSKLLKSSTLYSLSAGIFIFCVVWINSKEIFEILPDKFSGGLWVVFFIGLSKLAQMLGGVSGAIILYSKYYRFNLVLNLILILLVVITNLIFIPQFGIVGAAISTMSALFLFSITRLVYVYTKYKIHPFSAGLFKLIGSGIILFIVFLNWPDMGLNPFLEIMIKGSVFLVSYLVALRVLNIIPELTSLRELKDLF